MRQAVVILMLLVSASVFAGDFEDGKAAFERGEYAVAISKFESSARRGNADAQTMLGGMYYRGKGIPRDDQQARYWFTKAAERGHVTAQYNLGYMYANGKGVQ